MHSDALALQISDAASVFVPKQLVTADHYPGQQSDRFATIDRGDEIRRIIRLEINRAVRHSLGDAGRRPFDVVDIAKAVRAQQLFDEIMWRNAESGALFEPHGSGFERPLLGQHRRRVDEADNAGHRRGGQEAAAGLHYWH